MNGTAYFLRHPRRIDELLVPHRLHDEKAFEIVGDIALRQIDYENFSTDMLADRLFLEEKAALCGVGEIWKCLFVHQKGKPDGILVIPEDECYVGYAAYQKAAGS